MDGGLPGGQKILRGGGELPGGVIGIKFQQADAVESRVGFPLTAALSPKRERGILLGGSFEPPHVGCYVGGEAEEAGDAAAAEVAAQDCIADSAGAGPGLSAGRLRRVGQGDQRTQPRFRIAGLGPEGTTADEEGRFRAHAVRPPRLRSSAH